MFQFLLLLAQALAQQATRMVNPPVRPYTEPLQDTNYETTQDYTLILQYTAYQGAYSMSLEKIDLLEAQPQIPNVTLDPFSLPGCYPYERRLIQKDLFTSTPDMLFHDLPRDGYFTDMYVRKGKIYLVRDDYNFLVVSLVQNEQTKAVLGLKAHYQRELKSFFSLTESANATDFSNEPLLACADFKSLCYVFTDAGALAIVESDIANLLPISAQANYTIMKLNLHQSTYPLSAYIDDQSKLMFLAYGSLGVDVYAILEDGAVDYVTTIQPKNSKFIQVKTSVDGTRLYALDEKSGLYVYKIVGARLFTLLNFYIEVLNTQAFDFYENTFFIIANTQDNLPYALEIFVDFEAENYYINQVYSKDMDIYDVYVGKFYAILIGSDIHRVIYHSTYHKFLIQSLQPLYFENFELVNIEEYVPDWDPIYNQNAIELEPFSKTNIQYEQKFIVGVSDTNITLFVIKNIPPWIQCKASDLNKTEYRMTLNSTDCVIKDNLNDESAFSQCVVLHNFTFQGKRILFFQNEMTLALGILISLGVLILVLGVTLCCCYKKLKEKLQAISSYQQQRKEYQQQENEKINHDIPFA